MEAAQPFNCAVCGRRIGKTRSHILVGYPEQISIDRVLCIRCMADTRHLHRRFYPDCDVDWHDLHDHRSCAATRAGAARVLGLWPTKTTPPGPTERGARRGSHQWAQ